MSDRSYVSIVFYDCPPDKWNEVVEVLEKHGIQTGNNGHGVLVNNDMPIFPIEIVDEEVRLGSMADACREISDISAKIIFWAMQDAYYESYGDRCIQVEEGFDCREVDNSAHVPLPSGLITKLAQQATSKEDLESLLLKEIGEPYVAAAMEWREEKRKPQYVIEEMPTLTDVT